jgi:hypothetical protein
VLNIGLTRDDLQRGLKLLALPAGIQRVHASLWPQLLRLAHRSSRVVNSSADSAPTRSNIRLQLHQNHITGF